MIFLVAALGGSVYLFGDNATAGSNQTALLLTAVVAALVGIRNRIPWRHLEDGIMAGLALVLKPILILLLVGALIGVWILSGTVPALVSAGALLLSPGWFYPSVCLICALVALSIGSSWTTVGTIGVALIGVAIAFDLSLAITAGAIISGSYFGDKMSPLSDTTNLAAAVAEVNLFTHIRHMTWTSIPGLLTALIGFTILSIFSEPANAEDALATTTEGIHRLFSVSIWSLVPLVTLVVLSIYRIPPVPTLMAGIITGLMIALLTQQSALLANGDGSVLKGLWTSVFDGYVAAIEPAKLSELLNRGGMSSMLDTIWLIFCAITFSSVMESAGLLQRLVQGILRQVHSIAGLILGTMSTSLLANILTADQYMSIVAPGRVYSKTYEEKGLMPQNLSRALEDSGTLTSVLVPWNTCGAYVSGALGVATFSYLPYCFFNLSAPLFSALLAITGYTIYRLASSPEPSPSLNPSHSSS